ncbi:unnamed protein product [Phytomonas sp. Hart1]|nr:unnamed protein product [Phytomonas sp. Hart1]|eukprot:CCW70249.1 unnamed protein product [Phytomonas sp. isolate Hart1]
MSLYIQAYTDCALKHRMDFKIECISSVCNFLLVGTSDGKLFIYVIHEKKGGEWDAQIISTHTNKHKKPIRALTPLLHDGVVLALCCLDTIVVYALPSSTVEHRINPIGTDDLTPELSSLKLSKEIVTLSVKKFKGVFTVAVLHRQQLSLYEYHGKSKTLSFLKEGLSFTDKAQSVVWAGKHTLLVGFRKKYQMYNIAMDSIVDHLYATSKGQTPFLLSMHPVPEVLATIENTRLQRTLPDGSPVPGDSSIFCGSLPTAVVYDHPYVLCAYQGSDPRLEVYLPLVSNLPPSQRPPTASFQVIPVTCIHMFQRHVVDLDQHLPMTGFNLPEEEPRETRDCIWFLDSSKHIHILLRQPMSCGVAACCNNNFLSVGTILCQLCHNEVDAQLRQRALMQHAVHEFLCGNYTEALQTMTQSTTELHYAMLLYPDLLPSPLRMHFLQVINSDVRLELEGELESNLRKGSTTEALRCLIGFLAPLRLQWVRKARSSTSSANTKIKPADITKGLDTCLLKAYTLLGMEEALIDMLQQPNYCDLEDGEPFLTARRMWVAQAVWWKGLGEHAKALRWLQGLCIDHSLPAIGLLQPLSWDVFSALRYICIEDEVLPTEEFQPACVLAKQLGRAPGAETKVVDKAVAVITLAKYISKLSLNQLDGQSDLIRTYAPWLLRNIPTALSLSVFLSNSNRSIYHETLRIIQSKETLNCPGIIHPVLPTVDFLYVLISDASFPTSSDVAELHTTYWQSLALLVFGGAVETDTMSTAARRERLDSFLQHSSFVDFSAALEFFENPEIKMSSRPERAVVYSRMNDYERAMDMYLNEGAGSLDEAKAYAAFVEPEARGDVFEVLLKRLIQPTEGPSRMDEVLRLLQTSRGVNPLSTLPMLPDSMALAELGPFLIQALNSSAAEEHQEEIHLAMLTSQKVKLQQVLLEEQSKFVRLVEGTLCGVCHKRIRAEQPFVCYPNRVIAHEGCIDDEYVCPVTHVDFRKDILSLMHSI